MKRYFIGLGIGLNMFFAEGVFIDEPEQTIKYEKTCSRKRGRGYIK